MYLHARGAGHFDSRLFIEDQKYFQETQIFCRRLYWDAEESISFPLHSVEDSGLVCHV